MLEYQTLWLGPWSAAECVLPVMSVPPAYVVIDPVRHVFAGLVRERRQPTALWWGGITRFFLDVYEMEDESLLLVLARPWNLSRTWIVCDADGQRVGALRGTQALDAAGRPLAVLEAGRGVTVGCWRAPHGQELGHILRHGQGLLLRFEESVANQPLAKMVLLAMLLRCHWTAS